MGKIWDEYIAFTPQGKEKAPRFLAWLFDRMWEARGADQNLSDPESVRLFVAKPADAVSYGLPQEGNPVPSGPSHFLVAYDDNEKALFTFDVRSILSFPEIMLSDRAQPDQVQLPWQLPAEEL